MKIRNLKYFLLLIPFTFWSCSSDSDVNPSDPEADSEIVMKANVREVSQTRASVEDYIHDMNLNLTFRNSSSDYEIGLVTFNSDGLGYSYRYDNGNINILEDLLWSFVGSEDSEGKTYSFYIDNLSESFPKTTTVTFNQYDNPFRAAPYISWDAEINDDNSSSNDLLWGSLEKVNRANSLIMDLYHVMSRFSLRVYFDSSIGFEVKEPKSASVSNIFQSPLSFDRLTGSFTLAETPDEEDFVLVSEDEPNKWNEKIDEETGMTYYESPDFIVPPQEFVSNQRPRLKIKLTNDQVYSGLFPIAMNLQDERGNLTPWVMAFLRGYNLILNVKISNEPSTLEFMPATVQEWVEKKPVNITGMQASISDDKVLRELINAYTSGDTSKFKDWGYQESDGTWVFNVFQTLELNSSFAGSMPENPEIPYRFNLHYGIVTIKQNGENDIFITQENNGAETLKDFLSKGIIPS